MFPDSEHPPPCPAQGLIHQPVAGFVRGQFPMPERAIVFWLRCVLRATVPETTIHKDRELGFWKDEIWFAEYRLMPAPAGDFVPTK